ncbi:sigma-54-dependent transcriptional regulator [Aromatoleum evansii]|uniref:Sigma-54 dependent transcriptional regulator n=1 Tax=Aromatoleum evansii TaxID=59406 RepID=A0ABZ1AUZ1_AROEV|nr:sigma-54 dependent transcriptional regulator [Aromatoleum evansii]NMG27878.1 response regulator [Aromatoleum evansii]WRL47938.1 sigma-54 dependent transcriptional regulator [Aromatoleum evansii]
MGRAILVIEDEAVLGKNIRIYLERSGYDVRVAGSAEEGLALLDVFKPDAVILDFNLPGLNGLEALTRVRAFDSGIPVIMITGHGTVELAVEAMKAGARDFLTKPVALGKLKLLVDKAFDEKQRDSALDYYQRREADATDLASLFGDSPPMTALKNTLRQLLDAESQLLDSDAPAVLVLGETGTGKELVARALHFNGPRRDKPFVELNCASIPSQLLESELFGYERGAFTDARERKLGLVETAEGGTLFLDEIGDMDLSLQAKLLKLLEEKTVRRIGSLRDQRVNVRIVAATHRPMEALVREGRFRADLYFRLCVFQLTLPPLRERGADILSLARHFIALHASRYGKHPPALTRGAEALLLAHCWPGNVRELRNVLEQAVLLATGPTIDVSQLSLSTVVSVPPLGHEVPDAAPAAPPAPSAPQTLEDMERRALLDALRRTGWNVSRAARVLGISRDTLRYRIDKFGLTVTSV